MGETTSSHPHAVRRVAAGAWWVLLGLLTVLWLFPVRSAAKRAALVGLVAAVVAGVTVPHVHRPRVKLGLAAGAACLGFLLLPGRGFDGPRLAQSYRQALLPYQGTRYVWGGETRLGIDCSGLVRRGLADACLVEGLRTANPRLVRLGISIWWHDTSARALRDEHGGWTQRVTTAPSINRLDPRWLRVGDLAVTANGVHVLVHLGDRTWMQANPGAGRVLRQTAPVVGDRWYEMPVVVVRWQCLGGSR